jgi:hypothetical protein
MSVTSLRPPRLCVRSSFFAALASFARDISRKGAKVAKGRLAHAEAQRAQRGAGGSAIQASTRMAMADLKSQISNLRCSSLRPPRLCVRSSFFAALASFARDVSRKGAKVAKGRLAHAEAQRAQRGAGGSAIQASTRGGMPTRTAMADLKSQISNLSCSFPGRRASCRLLPSRPWRALREISHARPPRAPGPAPRVRARLPRIV